MNASRIVILGVALVAGGAAFFLMIGNSPESSPVQIVEPVKEQTARVLVSKRDIQRGERLAPEDTNWISWPKNAVQPSFITDKNPENRDNVQNAVARSLIVAGEPIVEAKIVKAGAGGLMSALITPGMRAVTLRVSSETASGGFILPGDHVDIHYTDDTGGNKARIVKMNSDVRVLAVNNIYSENSGTPYIEGKNITLEMTPVDAEYFMVARNSKGTLQLTLRSMFKPEGEIEAKNRTTGVTVIRYGRS